ncbi:hypothetical protein [Peribacillus sp. TH14]|uniref:hypothetical protein n=1 Tax=Peribacillus sp. TH14 TaxID=2798481 RepID=UPI0019133CEE|nr:hypothetical protein [Peribacillus sp. TH14]MBK5502835.1 hypothetical protein [Peribacillus sp. TH14]
MIHDHLNADNSGNVIDEYLIRFSISKKAGHIKEGIFRLSQITGCNVYLISLRSQASIWWGINSSYFAIGSTNHQWGGKIGLEN